MQLFSQSIGGLKKIFEALDWQGQGFIGREELLDECERLEKMEDVKIEIGLWEF